MNNIQEGFKIGDEVELFQHKKGDKNYYTKSSRIGAKGIITSLCEKPSDFEREKFKIALENDRNASWWYIEDLRLIKSKEKEILHTLEIW